MAATTLARPALEPSHIRSSSSTLHVVTDSLNHRRLSDSVIGLAQPRTTSEGESELIKLREWAAEAMNARPQSMTGPPLESVDDVDSWPMLRRDSEGRDRTLRPLGQGSQSMMNYHRVALDGSSSPKLPPSSDERWLDFLAEDSQARPTSMFVTPTMASGSVEQDLAKRAGATSKPSSGQLSRAASVRRKWHVKEAKPAFSSPSQSSDSTEMPPLPSSNGQFGAVSSTSASVSRQNRKSPPPRLQNLRSAFPSTHAAIHSPDQRTPRAKSATAPASPTLTSSTCGSEDDCLGLMTPLDENNHRRLGASSTPMRAMHAGDTPSDHTLGEDRAGERIGFERGLDTLGSATDHDAMQSMTGLNLAGRRGSLSVAKAGSEGFKLFATVPFASSDDERATERVPSSGGAPLLTQATLYEVGRINGITPPVSRSRANHSACNSFGSVVSAGLEMGMGVTMASSALSNQLPSASSSGINSFAEPRFSRTSGSSPLDGLSFATSLKMTDSQLPLSSVPAPPHYTPDAVSDRGVDEVCFGDHDREDGELARRRTTGGMAANKRDVGAVGKRRHFRTGTHDPRDTGNTAGTGKGGHHRLTASISTFPGLTEEDAQQVSEDAFSHGLTRLDLSSRGPPSSGASPSIISDAIASGGHGMTPLGTPLQSHRAMLSPDIGANHDGASYLSLRKGVDNGGQGGKNTHLTREREGAHPVAATVNGGLMGMGGGGHFGPGVRAKIAEVLDALLADVPLHLEREETVQLVEYGALNSRSAQLMQPIISAFASRAANQLQGSTAHAGHDAAALAATSCKEEAAKFAQGAASLTQSDAASSLVFQVTHEDVSTADFRPLTKLLDSHPESYLDAHWQHLHSPRLTNAIFSSFSARPFASRISPPQTFHAGISLMDLHWTHTPHNPAISSATTAQAELTTFLTARGHEFKQGGLLIMAYLDRAEEASTLSSPAHKDIWTTLSNTLAPCIQRLVSCSMVKSDVARHLLDLPLHPRSAKETKTVLKNVDHTWKVEWSCGLGKESEAQSYDEPRSESLPLRLPHPAWTAYNSGALSRIPFTEHMIQLFKNLYESHFRTVLREKGKLSKGAVEFVLDSLWDVLFSRIVDQQPSPMKDVEIQVSIVALRRR